MPFTNSELSGYAGRPLQLYEFLRTSGGINYYWRYNTSDRDMTYGVNLFRAVPISDSGMNFNTEAAATDIEVKMPISEDFCDMFRLSGTTPSDTVWLTIYRVHADDISDIEGSPVIGDLRMIWKGTVNGISQVDDIIAQVNCSMLAASFRRGGLRYGYQRSCPHVLYAPLTCKVDREVFRLDGTITAINGNSLESAGFASENDGWWNGGFIEYELPSGMIERRMVLTHTGDTIVIMGFPAGLSIGSSYSIFPGCDRTIDTCVNKFNNLANYGGFPHTPGRNPFDGMPVFDWWFVPLLSLASLSEFL